MSNGGNPSFDLDEQETWFAPLSGAVHELAICHNLLLDKFYHESASWSLRFNHPRGGQASVAVYNAGDLARVGSTWHVDDYDSFTRSIHWRHPREVPKDADSVRRELKIELTAILALPLGRWNQIASGYERIWGQHSKAAFQANAPKYPDPIP